MKKFLALMLLVVAAVVAPAASYAVNPELQAIANEVNSNLPKNVGDGLTLLKVAFPSDTAMEMHFSSADLAGITKSDLDASDRQAFREGFLGFFTPDNEFVQLCKMAGMKLVIVVNNPKGQEVIRETFKPSDF